MNQRIRRWTHQHAGRVCVRSLPLLFLLTSIASTGNARAQSLPSGWTARTIGASTPTGSATYASSTFTLRGAGSDVWGTADQLLFVYREISGDATIVTRVASVQQIDEWTKAGVMIRESLASNSKHAFALVSAGKGVAFQRRSSTGGSSSHTSGGSGTAPVWLKLERRGSTITAFRSSSGTSWTTIGSQSISMASTVYVGLAVSSHSSSLASCRFSNVGVSSVPVGWSFRDIGAPASKGNVRYRDGNYTVEAAGRDVWGTSDQFNFAYRTISGDVDVVARVQTLENTSSWAKAGIMIRSSLNANSAHAFVLASPGNGIAYQRRPASGMASLHTSGGSGTAPVWVKLERRGSAVTAFRSSNGTTWQMIDSQTLSLPSTFYVGLAVSSHDPATLATATFSNVTVGAPSSGSNQRPSVSLTAPANGASFLAPTSVTVSANASDSDGSVARVDFYAGSTLIDSDTSAPYSVTWGSAPIGRHTLTAVARDNDGATTTSAARTIEVTSSSPTRRAVFTPSENHSIVTRYQLDIFSAGADPSTAQPIQSRNLGKPAVVNGECSVDITSTWLSLPGGSYFATVTAVASSGSARSAPSPWFTR